ncbi:unnamed protein product [Parascedosporium putredinis]|uniref:Uncharacterized protein n=1 Tax=Parascedosporium putredinis TaxID=1442378 RepID=A0A9P1H565_9PEZI|nr:unnamed protein product [Parascedosporium putredinis]CAI7997458.1 unnamed protein product [Parascedosporium putredinis]
MLGHRLLQGIVALAASGLMSVVNCEVKVSALKTTTLGTDPEGSARLNGMSFQQDALTTFNGWQYVAYYESTGTYNKQNVALGRRNLNGGASPSDWEVIRFTDYSQQTQDSHNTISMGISNDGKIHLSYDHHDVPLNYRVSNEGVATDPRPMRGTRISLELRGMTCPAADRGLGGRSGSGDSYLYKYSGGSWTPIGKYIQGNNNNAYINGLDFANDTLTITWTWRETPDVVTNHDLGYAYSTDLGRTWNNNAGVSIGPTNSGILNQEGQTVDAAGRVHVINRETVGGTLTWLHYWRGDDGRWTRNPISHSLGPLTQTGRRGKLAAHPTTGDLFAILAANQASNDVAVYVATRASGYTDWKEAWRAGSFDVEPLFDRALWRGQGGYPDRKVAVVDLEVQV